MKMTRLKKLLSFILCMVLIAAMALFATGCNGNTPETPDTEQGQVDASQNTGNAPSSGDQDDQSQSKATVLGEGAKVFSFTVTDADGNEKVYEIHTDKTTVGEALLELEIIAGEEGAYGLYVKTVDGITLDYDTDGMYWAFYENGEYAMTGVDSTDITEGAAYAFKAEK